MSVLERLPKALDSVALGNPKFAADTVYRRDAIGCFKNSKMPAERGAPSCSLFKP